MTTHTLQHDWMCILRRRTVTIVHYFSNVIHIDCIYYKIRKHYTKIRSSLLRDVFYFHFILLSLYWQIMHSGLFPIRNNSEIINHTHIRLGGIPWTGDQPGVRPLPTQDNANRMNADIHASHDITWSFLSLSRPDSLRNVVNIVH
jgi:hypothetical protein